MNHALVEKLESEWKSRFGEPFILVQSPGRINLIGEHTDYNEGYVFPAAIDRSIIAAMMDNEGSDECTIVALDLDESFSFFIQDHSLQFPSGSWKNYIYGVVRELQDLGHSLAGFNMMFGGDIPQGAGLSSSAALENAAVFGLNAIFGLQLPKEEMILVSQRAEQKYAGVQCGIMDQYASMFGVEDCGLLLDCRSVRSLEKPIDITGYELVLVNSNVQHVLADTAYNERREECQAGVAILRSVLPELKALRDISMVQLEEVEELFPPLIYNRCSYIVKENQRVLEFLLALEARDMFRLGDILYEAHNDMRYAYEITCPEIDFLVDRAVDHPDVLGSRMMGGGFGGCTINLVEAGTAGTIFDEDFRNAYSKLYNKELDVYQIEISDGTRLI